jgi:hypothetical protein
MFIFEEQKIAFVFPPRTGSTTAVEFLASSKLKFVQHSYRHVLPEDAFSTYPHLKAFKVYGFFRHPAEVFTSVLLSQNPSHLSVSKISNLIEKNVKDGYFEFMEVYFKRNKDLIFNDMTMCQHKYYRHFGVIPLDFRNFESELRRVTSNLDLNAVKIGLLNVTENDKKARFADWLTPFVAKEYPDDFALWQEKFEQRVAA